MAEARYSKKEPEQIKGEVQYYESVRTEIKLASGDHIDLKAYEPAMRHLIDTYIDAEESKKISAFDGLTIIDLIAKSGVAAVDSLPERMRKDEKVVAEVIENNVRRLIIEENPTNPKYYEKMSVLLDAIIRDRKDKAIDYARYLKEIAELIQNVKYPSSMTTYPESIDSDSKRALYDNLNNNEKVALKVNDAILTNKPDGWRGNRIKERTVRPAIKRALEQCDIHDEDQVEVVLALARNQNDY
jgi:type I restriction enzyme R subunit